MRLSIAFCLLLASCVATMPDVAGPYGPELGAWRQQEHAIPITRGDGGATLLAGRICRPPGAAPARLVVIAHGSPPRADARPTMKLTRCDSEAAAWFLRHGFVVAFALRRGYGATGGRYDEGSTPCTTDAYVRSARETARDLRAVIAYATTLPYVRRDGVVVVGQSAGGWGTVGLDSEPAPGVVAMVSMAGGRGGHVRDTPNQNCHPENLIAAAGVLGRTAGVPMLWLYTENDSYFAPSISEKMVAAFTGSGGAAEFHLLPAFGSDGHELFFGPGGSGIWGPLVEAYLKQRGAL